MFLEREKNCVLFKHRGSSSVFCSLIRLWNIMVSTYLFFLFMFLLMMFTTNLLFFSCHSFFSLIRFWFSCGKLKLLDPDFFVWFFHLGFFLAFKSFHFYNLGVWIFLDFCSFLWLCNLLILGICKNIKKKNYCFVDLGIF
jgi:hypothetical protein